MCTGRNGWEWENARNITNDKPSSLLSFADGGNARNITKDMPSTPVPVIHAYFVTCHYRDHKSYSTKFSRQAAASGCEGFPTFQELIRLHLQCVLVVW